MLNNASLPPTVMHISFALYEISFVFKYLLISFLNSSIPKLLVYVVLFSLIALISPSFIAYGNSKSG